MLHTSDPCAHQECEAMRKIANPGWRVKQNVAGATVCFKVQCGLLMGLVAVNKGLKPRAARISPILPKTRKPVEPTVPRAISLIRGWLPGQGSLRFTQGKPPRCG